MMKANRRVPNIVLILADDMGYGDFSRFNSGRSSTPVLDGLMGEGISFSQHYAASPVCAPARAALLTGRYPHRTGVIDTLEARGTDRLALGETTLADALQRTGYRTGLVGKWHNGAIDPRYHPNRRGFDHFVGFRGGWQDYWDWRLERNGVPFLGDGRYLTNVLTEEAIRFVRDAARGPFFLHVAYNAPHFPFQAPAGVVDQFRSEGRSETVSTIYGMISEMDRGVGALLEVLDELGLADDTIVMFSSDNGPQLDGEGDRSTVRFNCGLAGQKMLVFDGGIRVPMVVRWPGRVAAGSESSAFVHAMDWFPTILDVLDQPTSARLDGRSLAPALVGEGVVEDVDRYWQWTRYVPDGRSNAAMRRGGWKLVLPPIDGTLTLEARDQECDERIKRHPEEFSEPINSPIPDYGELAPKKPLLFNLDDDPRETRDLSSNHPSLVSEMVSSLESWFESVESERRSIHDLS